MSRIAAAVALQMLASATLAAQPAAVPRLAHPERSIRVGFWFGMSNNEILTPAMTDWLGQRASFLMLNGMVKGPDPFFDYAACVARFKKGYPDLPVLAYDWFQSSTRSGRTGGEDHAFVQSHPEWLLLGKNGKPVLTRDGARYSIDATNPDYAKYLTAYVAQCVERYGVDGMGSDLYRRTLIPPGLSSPRMNAEELAAAWPAAAEQLLAAVKRAIGRDKILLFNGLWVDKRPGLWADQEKLLPFVDAASVEYFGHYVDPLLTEGVPGDSFEHMVLPVIKTMQANPGKLIPVYGRSPRYVYLGYDEDYGIQRYDLACYLLGATPLSTFKYHSHFQSGYTPPGRTYGLSYYSDWDLDIGAPEGTFAEADGVYRRRFARALVAVAPCRQGDKTLRLDRRYFTPEGESVEGTMALKAGTGAILLHDRPAEPPARVTIDDFEDGRAGEWQCAVRDADTRVIEEGGQRFLRARVSPDALMPYHERSIQPIRSLAPPLTRLGWRIRTADKSAAVLVRVEVDDASSAPAAPPPAKSRKQAPKTTATKQAADEPFVDEDAGAGPPADSKETRAPYVVLVVKPADGAFAFKPVDRDIPYGNLKPPKAPYFAAPAAVFAADGQWRELALDTAAALRAAAPHLTARRIAEMRLIGDADLDDIVLSR